MQRRWLIQRDSRERIIIDHGRARKKKWRENTEPFPFTSAVFLDHEWHEIISQKCAKSPSPTSPEKQKKKNRNEMGRESHNKNMEELGVTIPVFSEK